METLEFTLLSKSGIRSSSRRMKDGKTERAKITSINSLSLIIKNRLKNILYNSEIFDSVLDIQVVCSESYLDVDEEIETFFNRDWEEREEHVGYSFVCKGFDVKLFFEDSKSKNTFKLKGNLTKLLNKLNNHADRRDYFSLA